MTEFEYALRTIMLPSGHEIELVHAVAAGTLIAACGTVALPVPGSRWDDTDPDARCEACESVMGPAPTPVPPEPVEAPRPAPSQPVALVEQPEAVPVPPPAAAPVPAPVPVPVPKPAPTPKFNDKTEAPSASSTSVLARIADCLRNMGVRTRIALVAGLVVVAVIAFVVVTSGGGPAVDQNSPAYKNGWSYGRNLMNNSTNIPNDCARANVEAEASDAAKNFIAGCEAGYAARTP